jgi:hypothetical protein
LGVVRGRWKGALAQLSLKVFFVGAELGDALADQLGLDAALQGVELKAYAAIKICDLGGGTLPDPGPRPGAPRRTARAERQIFDAFELRVIYNRLERSIAVSATISETLAKALQNENDLPKEVVSVTQKDIAGVT